jgi:hypothetical protein
MGRQVYDAIARTLEIDYQSAGEAIPGVPHRHTSALTRFYVWEMANAFRAHGPSRFAWAAVHEALVTILTPLRVYNQHGKPWTAVGIKGLLRRHPPTQTIDEIWRQVTEKTLKFSGSLSPKIYLG